MGESLIPVLSGATHYFVKAKDITSIVPALLFGFVAGFMTAFILLLIKISRQEAEIKTITAMNKVLQQGIERGAYQEVRPQFGDLFGDEKVEYVLSTNKPKSRG